MRPSPAAPPLYAIADREALAPLAPWEGAYEMAAAGIRWIQLRDKHGPDARRLDGAERCREALAGSDAKLWIDDRADVAALVLGAAVHVGQADLPAAACRQVVGQEEWVGQSTHDPEQLRAADADADVDVIAFGPIFETTSKERPDPKVGLAALRRARELTKKPLIAIGGIGPDNVLRVLEAGADSAAIIGAVSGREVGARCRALVRQVEGRGWQ